MRLSKQHILSRKIIGFSQYNSNWPRNVSEKDSAKIVSSKHFELMIIMTMVIINIIIILKNNTEDPDTVFQIVKSAK